MFEKLAIWLMVARSRPIEYKTGEGALPLQVVSVHDPCIDRADLKRRWVESPMGGSLEPSSTWGRLKADYRD